MCYQVWASNTRWYVSNIGLGWQKFPTILPGQEQSAIVLQGALKIRNVNRCPHYNYLAILGSWMCALGFVREQRRDSILSDPTPCSFNGRHKRGSGRPCLFSEPKVGTSASLSSLPGSSQVILILLLSHPRHQIHWIPYHLAVVKLTYHPFL